MCKYSRFSPFLFSLDIFKSPVPLLFSGRSRISTISGLFCTLAITITLLIITFQSDLFQKKTPKILSIDIPQQYRKNVDFTGRLLAVGLQDELDGSGFWDPQVFNINVSLAMIEGANLIEREIKVKRCEKEDFKNFWNENLYTELNLKDNFCVDRKEEIELGGYWDEGTVKYLKIELKICDNATETGGCKGYDEIKQVFLRNNSFNIYFENAIIDINSYDNSVQKTVQNEYKSIDMNFKKIIEVSFKNIEINTDQGFVLEENHSDKGVKYDEEKFDFYYRSEIGADKTLFRYEFFASKNTLSIVRKYEKISDLLGKLCGVLKALTVLGFIITKIELNLGMKKKIIGLLFDFKHTELNEKKNSHKNNDEICNFSIFEYIKVHCKVFFSFRLNTREKFFIRGEERFKKSMEFTEILKKLHEFKLLKKIFLNEDQAKLFKHLNKPRLKLKPFGKVDVKKEREKVLNHFDSLRKKNWLTLFDIKMLENMKKNEKKMKRMAAFDIKEKDLRAVSPDSKKKQYKIEKPA